MRRGRDARTVAACRRPGRGRSRPSRSSPNGSGLFPGRKRHLGQIRERLLPAGRAKRARREQEKWPGRGLRGRGQVLERSRASRWTTRPAICAGYLHAARHHRPDGGQWDEVACLHIEGPTTNLERLAVSGVDIDELESGRRRDEAGWRAPGPRRCPRAEAQQNSVLSTTGPRNDSARAISSRRTLLRA